MIGYRLTWPMWGDTRRVGGITCRQALTNGSQQRSPQGPLPSEQSEPSALTVPAISQERLHCAPHTPAHSGHTARVTKEIPHLHGNLPQKTLASPKFTPSESILTALVLAICFLVCTLAAGCAHPKKTTLPMPPASKARIEALIDLALQLREQKIEVVPYEVFKQSVLVSIDIWESYAICVVDREELVQLASIDLAEMQGKLNAQTARADKNARHFWYAVGSGIVLSILSLLVGALAL